MPTPRYENLPQEKKERLISAALNEFRQYPYHESSINRIIHSCGISRGSFYTYFSNKTDLIFAIMQDFFTQLGVKIEHTLKQSKGDIFSAFIVVYDFVQEYSSLYQLTDVVRNLLLGLNADDRANLNTMARTGTNLITQSRDLVNFSNLRISGRENNEEFEDLIILLFSVTKFSCLESLVFSNQTEKAYYRERFLQRLNYLKYGLVKSLNEQNKGVS